MKTAVDSYNGQTDLISFSYGTTILTPSPSTTPSISQPPLIHHRLTALNPLPLPHPTQNLRQNHRPLAYLPPSHPRSRKSSQPHPSPTQSHTPHAPIALQTPALYSPSIHQHGPYAVINTTATPHPSTSFIRAPALNLMRPSLSDKHTFHSYVFDSSHVSCVVLAFIDVATLVMPVAAITRHKESARVSRGGIRIGICACGRC